MLSGVLTRHPQICYTIGEVRNNLQPKELIVSKKTIYTWRIPEPEKTLYIVGEESFAGGRNDEYEKGCKISRNDSLGKNVKLLEIQPSKESGISRDWDVHAILKDKPYNDIIGWDGLCGEGILNTEEAFYVKNQSLTKAEQDKLFCEAVSTILTKNKNAYMRTDDWSLRDYQKMKVDEARAKLRNEDEILMHVGMRGGKSVMALETARLFGLELVIDAQKEKSICRVLVITPFPSAIETFKGYTIHHKRMDGFNFYGNSEVPKKGDKKFVKLVSFQKEWDETLLKGIGDVDVIIVDETHHTSNSKRSTEILKKIFHKKIIHLSGTPLNDIFSGRFREEQIVRLDFIDLMKISKEHPESKIYPGKLNVYDVFNKEELKTHLYEYAKDNKAFLEWLDANQTFNLESIFEDEFACETFLKYISIDNRDIGIGAFYFDPKKFKHIISYIPSVKGVKIAYKCLTELTKNPESKFYGYKVLPVNEVDDIEDEDVLPTNASDMEKAINDFMDENDRTIVLTCNRFTTGVTLARLDTIFNFRSPRSAEWFFQVMFRIMTYLEGKDEVSMFNFDSEYTIQIFKELAASRITPDKTEKEVLEDTFKCINYYKSLKGQQFEFGLVDVDEGYELFRKLPLSHSPSAVVKYPISELTQDERDALLNSDFTTVPNGKSLNIHEAPGGDQSPDGNKSNGNAGKPNSQTNKKATTDKAKEKEEAKLNEKIVCIGNNVAWMIVNNKIVRVDELLDEANIPPIVVNWNLASVYNKLIGCMRGKWQQYIDDLNYRLRNKNYLDVVKNLPALSKTDKTTPETIRKEIIDEIHVELDSVSIDDIKSGWKFCDPCCGRGYIIFDVVEYLVNRLGEENRPAIMNAMYGVDIESHFVKLLNSIGYKNVKCGDSSKKATWLKKNWGLKYNCINGDCYMKFNLTVMNPPYEGEGTPLFMEIAKIFYMNCRTPDGKVVSVNPTSITDSVYDGIEKNSRANRENYGCMKVEKYRYNPKWTFSFGDASIGNGICITTYSELGTHTLWDDYVRGIRFGEVNWAMRKTIIEKVRSVLGAIDKKGICKNSIAAIKEFKSCSSGNEHKIAEINKSVLANVVILSYNRGNMGNSDSRAWDWVTLQSPDYLKILSKAPVMRQYVVSFSSKQDARNFIKWTCTDLVGFIVKHYKSNISNALAMFGNIPLPPALDGNYSDEVLMKYFGLTQNEMDWIHQEMKNFGWKVSLNKTESQLMDYIDEINK